MQRVITAHVKMSYFFLLLYFKTAQQTLLCWCNVEPASQTMDTGIRADFPANTGHLPNAVSMLTYRFRRWPIIETTLGECPVFARWEVTLHLAFGICVFQQIDSQHGWHVSIFVM